MTHNQAKRRLMTSEDFILFTRQEGMVNIIYRYPDSWDIILTGLVSSPELLEIFKRLVHEAEQTTDWDAEAEP